MTISKGSLGGQNTDRRIMGTRSSRVLSTIFKKLRKLDRKITELDKILNHTGYLYYGLMKYNFPKMKIRRTKLDEKRKNLRNLRKGYKNEKSN